MDSEKKADALACVLVLAIVAAGSDVYFTYGTAAFTLCLLLPHCRWKYIAAYTIAFVSKSVIVSHIMACFVTLSAFYRLPFFYSKLM